MSAIDTYLLKARDVLASGDANEIDSVAREIVAAFSSEIPHLSSYRGSAVGGHGVHTSDNLRQLVGKLLVLRDKKDDELYGSFGLRSITDSIRQLEDALQNGLDDDRLEELYKELDHTYANVLAAYTDGLCGYYNDDVPGDNQTKLRIKKLRNYRDAELRKIRLEELSGTKIIASASSEAKADSSVSVTLNMTNEYIEALPETSLSDDDKTALKGMLAVLSTKDSEKRKSRLQKLLSWLSNKGTDVFIAAMPYAVEAIKSVMQ